MRCDNCGAGNVDRPVSTVDVLPTVLDLQGIERTTATDGIHLLDDRQRVVIGEGPAVIAVRRGPWKALWKRHRDPVLWNLESGPEETRDLSGRRPEKLRELERLMREARSRPAVAETEPRSNRQWEGLRNFLESLLYL